MTKAGCKAARMAAVTRRRKDTKKPNGARPIDPHICQPSANDVLAGEDLAGRRACCRDFLRAAAPGLSRQGTDQRAWSLVPGFGVEDTFAALAHVQRRPLGAVRSELLYQHHRAAEIETDD